MCMNACVRGCACRCCMNPQNTQILYLAGIFSVSCPMDITRCKCGRIHINETYSTLYMDSCKHTHTHACIDTYIHTYTHTFSVSGGPPYAIGVVCESAYTHGVSYDSVVCVWISHLYMHICAHKPCYTHKDSSTFKYVHLCTHVLRRVHVCRMTPRWHLNCISEDSGMV
jgi:hypothetical protein